jgi:hypothetical protein
MHQKNDWIQRIYKPDSPVSKTYFHRWNQQKRRRDKHISKSIQPETKTKIVLKTK